MELGCVLKRGERTASGSPRHQQQNLQGGWACMEQKWEEHRLTPGVEAWAAGQMLTLHERVRGLGGNQEFCSGVGSRCSLCSLPHCLHQIYKNICSCSCPWANPSGERGGGDGEQERTLGEAEALGERFHLTSEELLQHSFHDLIAGVVQLLSTVS